MKLNYPMKSNGMYILKSGDFDDIAKAVLTEYMPSVLEWPQPVNIDYLATECLYLDIEHAHLTTNGSILGLIVFEDTEDLTILDMMYRPCKPKLPAGRVLIDYSLSGNENRPRARFTKAHESGHWVLHRTYHSPDKQQFEFRRAGENRFIACRTDNIERYKFKTEKTDSDWEEWQADRFAASILMPKETFTQYSRDAIRNAGVRRGFLVQGEDNKHKAYEAIETVAEKFCVSKRATQIRMVQLGLIVERDTYLSSFAAYY